MTAPTQLRLDVRPDAVAVLTIDQPGSRANVLTPDLWAELGDTFEALAHRTDLRGLVIASAKPGVFIAGADLKLLATAPGPNDPGVRAFIEQGLRVLETLESLPFATCAAIDGAALGGGLEVALACDFRVCTTNPKVQLGLPEVKLGLIPGWGGTQRLPRIVGLEHAVRMVTTGQSLDGPKSGVIGLVEMATQAADVVELAAEGAARSPGFLKCRERKWGPIPGIARVEGVDEPPKSPVAVREAVRMMVEGAALPLAEAIPLETEAFMRLAGSDESKRLIAEFFASRKKG